MKPLILLSFSLSFLTQGFADDSFAEEPAEQVNVEEQSEDSPQWCLSPYHEMHASIRHNEANGIGYKDGYTTLEAFGIYDGWGSGFMPFVDIRGHVFNDGYLAGNLGIGERTLFSSINHTFGSYLYYDVRRVGKGLTVNQLSPGLELVGERMEYRINGYFPVGGNKGRKFGYDFDKFTGNNILLKYKQNQAMMGGDAEVGVHIPQNTTYDVYAAAGPYYFHSSNASAWGGKVRVLGRYKEYVTLEVAYSYDHLFRNVVQGSIAFTLPFGGKLKQCGKCCSDNLLLSRAAFAPSRFEIPVVKKVHRKEKAINPVTGDPWVVWFVNNTSHSAGTFESPFHTLLAAQNASSPNNMIYVFPGDGTTKGMNAGITLKDGQNLFGSGIKQQFATTKGTMTIPALSGSNPSITNAAGSGNVVTIGNGNVVSGFNIPIVSGFFGTGITTGVNTIGATIANNIITATDDANGIFVMGSGTVNIYNNQISGVANGSNDVGLGVQVNGGVMSGVINNNLVVGFNGGIDLGDGIGSYDFTVEGNTVNNCAEFNIFANMPGNSTVRIISNTLLQDADVVGIQANDSISTLSGSVLIDNNMITITGSNMGAVGIGVVLDNATGSLLNSVVSNNVVQSIVPAGAGFNGIAFLANSPSTICLDLDNNTVTVPGSVAFNFDGVPGTINIDSIQGNVGSSVASTGNVNFVAPGTCD